MTIDEKLKGENNNDEDEKETEHPDIKAAIDILDSQGWARLEELPEWCNTPPETNDDSEKVRGENLGGGGRIKNPNWEVSLTMMMAS